MRPLDPNKGVWPTPDWLFKPLHQRHRFDLDAAASADNAHCPRYFTEEQNALQRPWVGAVWCNPPYGLEHVVGSSTGQWVAKARAEMLAGNARSACLLIPVKADTDWWHNKVCGAYRITASKRVLTGDFAGLWHRLKEPDFTVELLILDGRIKFGTKKTGMFASALLFFGAPATGRPALLFPEGYVWGVSNDGAGRPSSLARAVSKLSARRDNFETDPVSVLVAKGVSVSEACEQEGVSRAAYYRWLRRLKQQGAAHEEERHQEADEGG